MLTVGWDHEYGVLSGGGHALGALRFTSGTKEKPEHIRLEELFPVTSRHAFRAKENPWLQNGFFMHADGVALEFGGEPVRLGVSTDIHRLARQFIEATRIMHAYVRRERAGAYSKDHNLMFTPQSLFYTRDEIAMDPSYSEVGCDPDYSAWEGGGKRVLSADHPVHPNVTRKRAFGHHWHFGSQRILRFPPHVVAMLCDVFIASQLHLSRFGDHHRRQWYGLPGIYRPKPYGIEYRSLGHSPAGAPRSTAVGDIFHRRDPIEAERMYTTILRGARNLHNFLLRPKNAIKREIEALPLSAIKKSLERGETWKLPETLLRDEGEAA